MKPKPGIAADGRFWRAAGAFSAALIVSACTSATIDTVATGLQPAPMVDLVLVMSVNPGFGGQRFIDAVLPKIAAIDAMIGDRPIDLEVDGGITAETAGPCARAGANAFVAGSAVFKGGTIEAYRASIKAIRAAATGNRP